MKERYQREVAKEVRMYKIENRVKDWNQVGQMKSILDKSMTRNIQNHTQDGEFDSDDDEQTSIKAFKLIHPHCTHDFSKVLDNPYLAHLPNDAP